MWYQPIFFNFKSLDGVFFLLLFFGANLQSGCLPTAGYLLPVSRPAAAFRGTVQPDGQTQAHVCVPAPLLVKGKGRIWPIAVAGFFHVFSFAILCNIPN